MSATKDTYMHAYEAKLNKHLQDEWQQATWPSSKFPACTNASSHLQSKVVSNALPHPPGYCWSLGWKMTIMKVLSCCAQQWQAIAASTRSHLEGLELKLIETWFLFHPHRPCVEGLICRFKSGFYGAACKKFPSEGNQDLKNMNAELYAWIETIASTESALICTLELYPLPEHTEMICPSHLNIVILGPVLYRDDHG